MPSGSDSKIDAPDPGGETDKSTLDINTVQYVLSLYNVPITVRTQEESTQGTLYKGSSDTSEQRLPAQSIHSMDAC